MTSMYTRIGFIASAAGLLVNDQGMDNIDELELISDTKVDAPVKVVKHPGDITGAGGAALGTHVSMQACTNLKLTCYFIPH